MGLSLSIVIYSDQTQVVSAITQEDITIGYDLNVTIKYDVLDNNINLFGIGINVHYNSQMLKYIECSNFFENNIENNINEPKLMNDVMNKDEDIKTDKIIQISWYDPNENWPGEESSFPIDLSQLKFLALSKGTSNINITFSYSSYLAISKNLTITIDTIENIEQLKNSDFFKDELKSYDDLAIEYSSLSNSFNFLTNNYTSLSQTYISCLNNNLLTQSSFKELSINHFNLTNSYNKISDSYDNLSITYILLAERYNDLSKNYMSLNDQYFKNLHKYEVALSNYNELSKNHNHLIEENTFISNEYDSLSTTYDIIATNYKNLSDNFINISKDNKELKVIIEKFDIFKDGRKGIEEAIDALKSTTNIKAN